MIFSIKTYSLTAISTDVYDPLHTGILFNRRFILSQTGRRKIIDMTTLHDAYPLFLPMTCTLL